ncbi:MAG: methyltransferase domain-containing protein [Candidatus Hydrogenedentes bacterium]|nr:methyltransferase domain-containing protein [Candidatus Hydrogenedentota bacterium]
MSNDENSAEGYRAFHAPRYAYLLRLLESLGVDAQTRVLDIGPSHFTTLARGKFGARVDTLGFGCDSKGAQGDHYEFDLNCAQNVEDWRKDLPHYDVIVMAEVLEHLYVAPQLALAFLKSLLALRGYLVLQTPNAASISKRIHLLFGKNPYEMIRIDPQNPGHYREYTAAELRALASNLGFNVERVELASYFDARCIHDAEGRLVRKSSVGAAKNVVYRFLPGPLRHGITCVLRADEALVS